MLNRRRRRDRLLVTVVLFSAVVIIGSLFSADTSGTWQALPLSHGRVAWAGRQLLEAAAASEDALNCTPRSLDQFPADLMTERQRKQGGVLFHIFVCVYIFGALAIVCDEYFVASLEKLSTILNIQSDVAGATFMAAGSSAPELFTSIIGVLFAKSDVGLGTIVGSAVFNILIIIAIVALFAGQVIHLLWWPMSRDCFAYVLSVMTLALVIMDNYITWYEAVIMVALYILYIVVMVFNARLGSAVVHRVDMLALPCCRSPRPQSNTPHGKYDENSPLLSENGPVAQESSVKVQDKEREILRSTGDEEALVQSGTFQRSHRSHISEVSAKDDTAESEFESPLTVPGTWPRRVLWAAFLPVSLLFMLSIPDCRRPGCWARLFPLTFIISICWLGVLSYIMVWMVTIIGDTLGIPDAVLGLTLLAAGTSIPDALASLFVAKDGYGDMAVSNSIGSNIFDILVCLGMPWLLQTVFIDPGSRVHINSNGILYTSLILLGTVVFLLAAMMVYRWTLDKKIGVVLVFVYVLVIVIACLFETNVFGNINLPSCPKVSYIE